MPLPLALTHKTFPKQGTMKIQTSVLEPQIATPTFVRYVLEKRAILGSDSIFTFGLTVSGDQAATYPTMPVNTGISCLIKNCTLRLGNIIVSRTQDWGHFDTVARCFRSPEERTLKDTVTHGTLDTMRPSPETDGTFSLHNATYLSSAESVTPYQLDLFNNPVFSISLSELFPALNEQQIPLGHMQDNMVVEFELNTQAGNQQGILATDKDHQGFTVTPNLQEMTMMADYLSFSDATHDELEDIINGEGMIMPFYEIEMIRGTMSAGGAAAADVPVNQELGLAGRMVRGVAVVDTESTFAAGGTDIGPQGVYTFQKPGAKVTTQMKINDLNVYPRPMSSVTQHINEVNKVFSTGSHLRVTRAEYEGDASGTTVDAAVKFITWGLDKLNGSRFMTGVPLVQDPQSRRGTLVRDKPIRYERVITRDSGAPAMDSRYFCALEAGFRIQDGLVTAMA